MMDELAPGSWLAGKYVIERVLGQGGMGRVVLARHAQLGQPVAIKVIRPDAAIASDLSMRFQREAWAAATLTNEHVVRVFDVGVLPSGAPFMVMEYIEGQDLARVTAARGPLPWGEALGYVIEACVGLAEAHARGIVHRDLKPSNLFLAQQSGGTSRLKVLDFGIAKAPTTQSRSTTLVDAPSPGSSLVLTGTRGVLGSPLYMAPEQFRSPRDVDARADVWSLGVILFHLLAGAPPFTGRTVDELVAAILRGAPSVRSLRADVPEGVAQVIQACLQVDLARRLPTVGRLAVALASFAPSFAPLADRAARALGEEATSAATLSSLQPSLPSSPPAFLSPPGTQPFPSSIAPTAGTMVSAGKPTGPVGAPGTRRIWMLGVFALGMVVGPLVLMLAVYLRLVAAPPAGQETQIAPLPKGSARRVDVVALYPEARKSALRLEPQLQLLGFVSSGVVNGLVDLDENGTVTYFFQAAATARNPRHRVAILVFSRGMQSLTMPDGDRSLITAPEPTCAPAQLWRQAAMPHQRGQINYGIYANPAQPASWSLQTSDGVYRRADDPGCKVLSTDHP